MDGPDGGSPGYKARIKVPVKQIDPIYIRSVSMASSAHKEGESKMYPTPLSTVMGIKNYSLSVQGHFGQISNGTNPDGAFKTDINYILPGDLLEVIESDPKHMFEFHLATSWLVRSFAWDRAAQREGFWEFKMELLRIWGDGEATPE